MLRFFERLLEPTGPPPDAPPPVLGDRQALVGFYWHFVRQIPGPIAALFVTGFCVAIVDALIPVSIGRIVALVTSTAARCDLARGRRAAVADGGAVPDLPPGGAFRAADRRQSDPRAGADQPGALAEPLACRAAGLDVLPERFRRPHRRPRHADGAGAARERRAVGRRHLVHPGLRHDRDPAALDRRLAARFADHLLVRPVWLGPVALPAADARALAGDVGDALGPDRQDRRQLHEYPDGQAVRPGPRRGRVRARRGRRAHRDLARAAAHRDVVGPVPAGDERAVAGRHRRAGDRVVGERAHRGRHGRDRDPDGVADQQHVRRAGAADREHLRRCRAGAGRHALDRGGAADARPAGRGRDAARRRRDPLREGQLSTTAARSVAAASCGGSTSMSRRASGSGWSAAPAPANRRWCICCSGSTGRKAGAS